MERSFLNKALGDYIKQKRMHMGLTKVAIARHVKISPQFWGHIEKGDVGCPRHILIKLISKLSLDPKSLREIFVSYANHEVENLFAQALLKRRRSSISKTLIVKGKTDVEYSRHG